MVPRISLIFEGTEAEDLKVLFADFLRELQVLMRLLNETDRHLSRKRVLSTYYRVINLHHSSPALVELEARPLDPEIDQGQKIVDSLIEIMIQVGTYGSIEREMSYSFLAELKAMTVPIGRTLSRVEVRANGKGVEVDQDFKARVNDLLRPEETYPGSVRGMLEAINIHGGANQFRIYPDIGPTKITCKFPSDLGAEAVKGLGRFVKVSGLMKYKTHARFSHEIAVEDLEVFPEEEQLPSLYDVQGIAPEATGDLLSEEFVRELRSATN